MLKLNFHTALSKLIFGKTHASILILFISHLPQKHYTQTEGMEWVLMAKKSKPNPLVALVHMLLILNECRILTTTVVAGSNVHIVYMGRRKHNDPMLVTDSHHQILTSVLGSKEAAAVSIIYSYKHGFSGFAAKLTVSQAQQIAEIPGVVRVMPNSFHKQHTTRSWDYLGLSSSSPSNLLNHSNMGEGIIIGVMDSGVWPESKAFSDEGLGPIPSRWKGFCESGEQFNATIHCNKKLIGARWFVKGLVAEVGTDFIRTELKEVFSPRDIDGHGTHTASTAAGSIIPNGSYEGLGLGTVRGGAPRARVAMYKTLWGNGGTGTSADILEAFDKAIHDGVDVLSLSLGFGIPIFSDVDEHKPVPVGSFHAVVHGITVVCSAGNDGPQAQTVDNTSPWIITVGASTMDRAFPTLITLGNNRTIMGAAIFTGNETTFKKLVSPILTGRCEDLLLNGTSVMGNIAFCFSTDGENVTAIRSAGAAGLIIARNPNNFLNPSSNDFPIIQVDYELGTQILQYIRSTKSPVVKLSPSKTLVGKPVSSKVAQFSSRGPNSNSPMILKPDIAAPGANILAAVRTGFEFQSGTSMSAPHISGIVALLKSLNPRWSPAAIKSAIVTTAWTSDPFGEPIFAEGSPRKLADPFDYGGGIVNPNRAADPGLVYDMGIVDYVHYLCAKGFQNSVISQLVEHSISCPNKIPSALDVNLPSITIPSLRNITTLTRNVTNVGAINSTYNAVIEPPLGITIVVKPDVLVFNPGTRMISFTVTVSTSHQVNTGYYFGSLTWNDGVHSVRSPISVRTQVIGSYVDYN